MDLTEGKKSWNVWKLESEAFKKPIEIKIWYDNKELAEFKSKYDSLRSAFDSIEEELDLWNTIQVGDQKKIKELEERLSNHVVIMWRQSMDVDSLGSEIKQLYKVIADLKTTVETLSGTIIHLQEQTSLIQKKITKVPMVFHDKSFISWRESSGLWVFELNDGDYLMILKTIVWECNEYVVNQDDIVFDIIHVEGQHYIPFYKLEWGTELDTPTATIYYDLVFIPM